MIKLICCALITVASSAFSQSWPQEPKTVFGIELGQMVTKISIPQCRHTNARVECINYMGQGESIRVDNFKLPDLDEHYLFSRARARDEKIESVALNFWVVDYKRVKAMSVERSNV